MNITLFNKNYWIRRFGEQKLVRGYYTSGAEDFVLSANMHPMGTDKINALPEGERRMKYLEGHGNVKLRTADEKERTKADLLFYHGEWYECTSCQMWDHTLLSHYNYQFGLVPQDASQTYDLEPPVGEPVISKTEGGGTF